MDVDSVRKWVTLIGALGAAVTGGWSLFLHSYYGFIDAYRQQAPIPVEEGLRECIDQDEGGAHWRLKAWICHGCRLLHAKPPDWPLHADEPPAWS